MQYYALLKALHIISMTAWMAGMFYLPRLYAYHAGIAKHETQNALFKVMERRLLRIIINPAMLATWTFGLWMAIEAEYFTTNPAPWLHVKLALVLAMSALHGYFSRCRRRFVQDRNTHSPRFYKIINEVVTVIFIGIVLLVVLKPQDWAL